MATGSSVHSCKRCNGPPDSSTISWRGILYDSSSRTRVTIIARCTTSILCLLPPPFLIHKHTYIHMYLNTHIGRPRRRQHSSLRSPTGHRPLGAHFSATQGLRTKIYPACRQRYFQVWKISDKIICIFWSVCKMCIAHVHRKICDINLKMVDGCEDRRLKTSSSMGGSNLATQEVVCLCMGYCCTWREKGGESRDWPDYSVREFMCGVVGHRSFYSRIRKKKIFFLKFKKIDMNNKSVYNITYWLHTCHCSVFLVILGKAFTADSVRAYS